jgi:transcriptional regulator with XRE-family HTH domain
VSDLSPEQRRAFERELLYGEAVEQVRALMQDLGLSQRDLAHRLKVTDARMSQILSGRENLTLRTVADLGWSSGVRFTLVAEPVDREGTPAKHDPPPPRWLARHARVVAQRVREALSA